jgi:hypothetical protein
MSNNEIRNPRVHAAQEEARTSQDQPTAKEREKGSDVQKKTEQGE